MSDNRRKRTAALHGQHDGARNLAPAIRSTKQAPRSRWAPTARPPHKIITRQEKMLIAESMLKCEPHEMIADPIMAGIVHIRKRGGE